MKKMAETTERERKKLFVQLMHSLKEYTTEVIADHEAVKPIVLELLKFHHPIKLVDYEYGLSRSLKKNHRLIIKESEDKTRVREYVKIATSWYCSNRVSQRIKCTSANLEIKYGIVFAPNNHNNVCIAKDYSYVMKIQGFYQQGKKFEARSFVMKNGSSSNKSLTDSMLEDSILNESNLSSLETESATPLSHDTPASIDTSLTVQSQSSSPTETESESTTPSVKREFSDIDDCMVVDEPAAKRPKLECNNDETFAFGRPSDLVLQKMCQKLKIKYNHDAYKLWGEIVFKQVVPVSENIQTHDFKSPNFYAVLSLFFTGTVFKCHLIEDTICTAFRNELTVVGSMSASEMNQLFANHKVTDELFAFIAKFLSCSIGIYEKQNLKKFGKWETENNDVTLILSSVNELYSVVLNL